MSDSMSQHCPNCEAQAGEIVGLKAQLHMVLDREADTHCRHDAKVEALEAEIERLRGALELADAALRGANMNMNVVERKIRAALEGKAEQ
jgi:hypothetical protein